MALKDAVMIDVDPQWDPLGAHHLMEDSQIALGIFLLAKLGRRHRARRVINGADQRPEWSLGAEPTVPTAIRLQQHAFPGHPIASTAMVRWPPHARRPQTGR
jgi:hypothetical protein